MYCTRCGTQNDDQEAACSACDHPLHPAVVPIAQAMPPAAPDLGDDPAIRMLLPVGRSGWAIAAGYLGLFSVIGVAGPFALVISIIAIVDLRRHPKKCGWGRAVFGLIMGILGTIGLLFFLAAYIEW